MRAAAGQGLSYAQYRSADYLESGTLLRRRTSTDLHWTKANQKLSQVMSAARGRETEKMNK
jgi:hypothetical protein